MALTTDHGPKQWAQLSEGAAAYIVPAVRVERAYQALVRAGLREKVDAVGVGGAVERIQLDVVQPPDPRKVAALLQSRQSCTSRGGPGFVKTVRAREYNI